MKLFPIIGAMLAAATATAQLASPTADGFLSRGLHMRADRNYPGAVDQLGRAIELGCEGADGEALLWQGIASARLGEPKAPLLLRSYLDRYPASPLRCHAVMALGDIDFNAGDWPAAFKTYSAIDPRTLDGDTADALALRMGFCHLMLGNYDAAAEQMGRLEASPVYGNAALFYKAYIDYARGNYAAALPAMERVEPQGEPGESAPYYIMQMRFVRNEWRPALDGALKILQSPQAEADARLKAEALRVAGESLYNLGEESKATGYLWNYAAMTPDPAPSAFYILGVSEYRAGNDDAAIKLLQRVIPAGGVLAQSAYLTLGQAYQRRGDRSSALMAFENAYRNSYDRDVQETAFYNYAVARMDGGRVPFGSSVNMLEDFLREFPDSRYAPEVEKFVVTGYMTDNDYDAALAAISRVKKPSQAILKARQRVLFVLATRDFQAGRIEKARSNLRALQEMGSGLDDSLLTQSYLWMGDCLYTNGDYNGAAASYDKFITLTPRTDPNYLTACYDRGYALFSAGKYAEALKAFGKAADAAKAPASHPRLMADIQNRMGDCRYYASQFGEAKSHYARAYELSPDDGDYALYQLAIVKGMTGDHRGKVEGIDRLVKDFPSTGLVPQALLEKAESLAALGDTNGAIATYGTLVKNHAATAPGRNGYLQLALIYLNTGKRAKAEEAYRTVIRTYPTSDEARLAADDLKRLLAADGRLQEYADFAKTVPGAPALGDAEREALALEALFNQAESAWNQGDASRAARLAAEFVEKYPHSEVAEQALLIKGSAESELGRHSQALATFRKLEKSASGTSMLHDARMGMMRSASAVGKHKDVIATADLILASSATPAESIDEVRYFRALACDRLKRHKEADREWSSLAAHPATIYGAMSAVALAQSQLDRGKLDEAAATADALINANPPHAYWLARGFIVYSDVLRKRGDTFEADEYLKSLRANYPGNEADIREMINQRLR